MERQPGRSSFINQGHASAWFRTAQIRHEGHIRAGGVEKDVTFVAETDPGINDKIDAAYRSKYSQSPYVGTMVTPEVSSMTLKLMPRTSA